MFNSVLFRWYQLAAIQALFDFLDTFQSPHAHPLVAMPTATGKSWVIAGFIQRVFDIAGAYGRRARVMMITDDETLIEQNLEKLLKIWPTAPVGVHSAGLNRYDIIPQIIFGGIQSMFRKAGLFGHVDFILIDEAHMVSPKNLTMYRKLLTQLKIVNPNLRVIGFSATCFRMGQGLLTDGEDRLFTDICYDLTNVDMYNRLVAEGWLSPLIPQRANYRIDVSGVKITGGEYDEKQQQAAVNKREVTVKVLDEMMDAGANRNRWLIFATGVEHCNDVSTMLRYRGIDAVPIHSKMSDREYEKNFFQYKTGQVRAAVAMNSMTKGVDVPEIDYIAYLRHTNSAAFWVQSLGRGGRVAPWAGKLNCLVSDFTSNTRRLGPINDPVIPRPKIGKKRRQAGVAPVKICGNPKCRCYVHASLAVCNFCGYEFPSSVKFSPDTDGLEVQRGMIEEPRVEEWKIDAITYHILRRRGQTVPPSLMVSYICGLQRAPEFLCFEHGAEMGLKAKNWWRERTQPGSPVPLTVADAYAMSNTIIAPYAIRVWTNARPRPNKIVGYIWR